MAFAILAMERYLIDCLLRKFSFLPFSVLLPICTWMYCASLVQNRYNNNKVARYNNEILKFYTCPFSKLWSSMASSKDKDINAYNITCKFVEWILFVILLQTRWLYDIQFCSQCLNLHSKF